MNNLYDRLESYEEIERRCGSLEEALKEEKHRCDLLEKELSTQREVVIRLRGYVKHRFDRLLSSFQKARQRNRYYEGILAEHEDRKSDPRLGGGGRMVENILIRG